MTNFTQRILISSILVCLSWTVVFASKPAETAEKRVRKMIETTSVPGMSVTVIKNGKIVFSKGFGKASLEYDVPVTANTKFRLASVSKLVTAAALARLVDSGKIDLDAPISRYVKDLPESLSAVTARQLAGHLAGIRHYQRKDFVPVSIDNNNYPTVVSSLEIFKDDPLVSEPGTAYNYTTFGFTLLAAVIQGASGKPFLEYTKKQVFDQLKLESAGADSPFHVIPHRTSFYMAGPNDAVLNASYVNPSYKWAGGGMLMTSEDLARFGNAHLDSGFLKESTLREMFVSQKTIDGQETGVGITWRIAEGYFGNTIYHHEGSMNGARSALLLYPAQNLVVAFMTNFSGVPRYAFETAQLVAEPFLERPLKEDIKAAGVFDVSGKVFGKDVEGTLEIRKSDEAFVGAFDFGQDRLEVMEAIKSRDGYYLVVVHETGGLDVVPVNENGKNGPRYDLRYTRKGSTPATATSFLSRFPAADTQPRL